MNGFNLTHFKHRLLSVRLDGSSEAVARLLHLKLHEDCSSHRCCCISSFLTFEAHSLPFGGVFPSDRLPHHQPENVCYIFNSDPSTKPGKHWIAYYQVNGQADFFDSFGRDASDYPSIHQWLLQGPFQPVRQMTGRLQGPSLLCGPYCLFFLAERSRYATMKSVFSENCFPFRMLPRGEDDTLTHAQLKRYFGLNDAYVFAYLADKVNRFVHAF